MLYKDQVGCILKLISRSKIFFLSHSEVIGQPLIIELNNVCLFVFVALRPMSTAMVIEERSVHLTTLFPGQA